MIDSDAIKWEAPDWDHPARLASRRSAALVSKGDKEGWLSLFAEDALIEDPVGPSFLDPEGKGHRGRDQIAGFWDSYVGMISSFRFHITDSFANGPCCANVARITTTLADASTMDIDCILIYTVDATGLIKSLRAHWEPERALGTIRKADSSPR